MKKTPKAPKKPLNTPKIYFSVTLEGDDSKQKLHAVSPGRAHVLASRLIKKAMMENNRIELVINPNVTVDGKTFKVILE